MAGRSDTPLHTLFLGPHEVAMVMTPRRKRMLRMWPKYTQCIQETARNLDTRISEINDFRQAVNLLALWRA